VNILVTGGEGNESGGGIGCAELRIVEGADTLSFHVGDFGPTLDEVAEFVTGKRKSVTSNRTLSTVLFTDIVGSTSLASKMGDDRWLDLRSEHDKVVHVNLERHRGTTAKMT
jgi:class 3 adenylate cyclase